MTKIKTALLLLFVFCLGCNQNKNHSSGNTIAVLKPQNMQAAISSCSQKTNSQIVGTYYVNEFYQYLTTGFELQSKKPETDFILYTFEFKKNGIIIFNDLTKFYDCGNGVMSISNAGWKAKENNVYTLTFDGAYALESRFHTVAEYRLEHLKNGNLKMKLLKVIHNTSKSF